MALRLWRHLRNPQPHGASADDASEVEPVHAERVRIPMVDLVESADALPIALARLARMPRRRAVVNLRLDDAEPGPEHVQRAHRHRARPDERDQLGMLRRNDLLRTI